MNEDNVSLGVTILVGAFVLILIYWLIVFNL